MTNQSRHLAEAQSVRDKLRKWLIIDVTALRAAPTFTVTLRDRQSAHLMHFIDNLRPAFRQHARPFQIDAIVVLPEHLHTIWTLPEGDDDYAGR